MREPIDPQLDADQILRWGALGRRISSCITASCFCLRGGSADYDRISFNVRTILEAFGADLKIRVAASSFYYGDAGVVCEALDSDAFAIDHPCVVAEVLSPSTRNERSSKSARRVERCRGWNFMSSCIPIRGAWKSMQVRTTACLGTRDMQLDAVYARSSLA